MTTIPYADRLSSTVEEACDATGLGKTKLYELIAAGKIETATVGTRRLILVRSVLRLIDPTYKATYKSSPVTGELRRSAAESAGGSNQHTTSVPVSKYGRRRLRSNA